MLAVDRIDLIRQENAGFIGCNRRHKSISPLKLKIIRIKAAADIQSAFKSHPAHLSDDFDGGDFHGSIIVPPWSFENEEEMSSGKQSSD